MITKNMNTILKEKTLIITSSKNAIQLKKEQSKILREYLKKGYFCVKDWKTEEIGNQLMLILSGCSILIY